MAAPLTVDTAYASVGTEARAGTGYVGKPWGTGAKIGYLVSSNTIRVELSDGRKFDFVKAGSAGSPFAESSGITVTDGGGKPIRSLFVIAPEVGGVTLSYLRWASFVLPGTYDPTGEIMSTMFVFGHQTANMPVSGTATYAAAVGGTATVNNTESYIINNAEATASVTANFGAGTVSTLLHLIATPSSLPPGSEPVSKNLGQLTGTGTISGATIQGAFADGSGGFWGSFFGPSAAEVGYGWIFESGTLDARGVVTGRKN